MKHKYTVVYIAYILIGVVLFVLGVLDKVDSFWSGMGSTLCVIGIIRLMRNYRLNKDEEYREKMEIELTDERNRFIRNKAWAWSGYLYVLMSSIACIVFKMIGQEQLSIYSGLSTCIVITLFWLSYVWLKKKY